MHNYILPFQDSDVVAKVWLRLYYLIGRKLAQILFHLVTRHGRYSFVLRMHTYIMLYSFCIQMEKLSEPPMSEGRDEVLS